MFLILMTAVAIATELPSAQAIMTKIDQNMNFHDRRAEITMIVEKGRRQKQYTMSSHGAGQSDSAIEMLSPPRNKGMKILKKEGNVWIYMPSIERVQKISGHMLRQGMLGSDMSYEDMMSPTQLRLKYHAALMGEVTYEGIDCYKLIFTSVSKDTTYFQRVSYIDKSQYIPVFEELYSESGMLIKTWRFDDIATYEGRKFPRKMIVNDRLQINSTTTILFTALDFEPDEPSRRFTHRWLNR